MAEVQMPKSSINEPLEGSNSKNRLTPPTVQRETNPAPGSAHFAPERKKTFKDKLRASFIGSDANSIGEYLLFNILVPAIKNTAYNLINSSASMFILGNGQPQQYYDNRRPGSYVSYNYVASRPGFGNNGSYNYGAPAANVDSFRNISYATKAQADSVLSDMLDYIYSYNYVTVAKYYGLSGLGSQATYQDEAWGWYSLNEVASVPSSNEPGRWILTLPKARPIRR